MSEKQTAFGRIHFNEFGDYLDKPYVVRANKSFNVNRTDPDGFLVENEFFTVEEGSVWHIYSPFCDNDVELIEAASGGNVYHTLSLNWDALKLFELVEEGGYYDDDEQPEYQSGDAE